LAAATLGSATVATLASNANVHFLNPFITQSSSYVRLYAAYPSYSAIGAAPNLCPGCSGVFADQAIVLSVSTPKAS
jgi:hypothetical protein